MKKNFNNYGNYNSVEEFLSNNEKIVSEFNAGMHKIFITTKKFIFKNFFTQKFSVFNLDDVELVEFETEIKWVDFVIAMVGFSLSLLFKKLSSATISVYLNFDKVFLIIGFVILLVSIVELVLFIQSLFSKLKIYLRYSFEPLEIYSSYNKNIPKIINALNK